MSTIAAKPVPARRPARARRSKNPTGAITRPGIRAPGFTSPRARRAQRLTCVPRAAARDHRAGARGLRLRDPGSVTAGSSYAGDDRVPELIQDQRDGSRRQRDKIITKSGDFGRGRAGGR